jgi:hypothetical protein
MNLMRIFPAAFVAPWFFVVVGCKTDPAITFSQNPSGPPVAAVAAVVAQRDSVASATNVYYKIEGGPGCALFLPESVNADFGGNETSNVVGGTKVIVINGNFPLPNEMPQPRLSPPESAFAGPASGHRDMALLDTTAAPPTGLKPSP